MTDDDDLMAAERRRCAAIVAADVDGLSGLLADELVHVHTTGLIDDKPSYLSGIRDRLEVRSVERGPLRVRRFGDTAVMTGELTNTVRRRVDGPAAAWTVLPSFVTQVWVGPHTPGAGWRMASYHSSRRDIS